MSENGNTPIIEGTENIETGKNGRKPDGTFGPGNCANPHGRPRKGHSIADAMREYLKGEIDTEGGKITRQEALVKSIFDKAMKGGDGAQKLMLNYVDGLPLQNINVTSEKAFNVLVNDDEKKIADDQTDCEANAGNTPTD